MIRYRMDIANHFDVDYCNNCWVEPTADPKGVWVKAEDVEQARTALRAAVAAWLQNPYQPPELDGPTEYEIRRQAVLDAARAICAEGKE